MNKSSKSAFTLIEMLVVMALMALLIGVGMSSFFGMGQGSSLTGAVNELQGALALARQQTVMHRTSVNIYFYVNDNSYDIVYEMWAMTNGLDVSYSVLANEQENAENQNRDNEFGYQIGSTYHFPKGLTLEVDGTKIEDSNDSEYITLRPTGMEEDPSNPEIEIMLPDKGYGKKLTLYSLTGLTKVEEI